MIRISKGVRTMKIENTISTVFDKRDKGSKSNKADIAAERADAEKIATFEQGKTKKRKAYCKVEKALNSPHNIVILMARQSTLWLY